MSAARLRRPTVAAEPDSPTSCSKYFTSRQEDDMNAKHLLACAAVVVVAVVVVSATGAGPGIGLLFIIPCMLMMGAMMWMMMGSRGDEHDRR